MLKPLIMSLCLLFIGVFNVHASSLYIEKHVNEPVMVGKARYTYLLFDVYDAKLFAPKGIWSFEEPFALELTYLRNLSGQKIAVRSAEEIRDQGFEDELLLAGWYSQMKEIFPDVSSGSVITGVYLPNDETLFYHGDELIGRVQDPKFGRRFFGIWLSDKTSEPEFKNKLTGQIQ
ncbi:MAG: chalcone isomerase family protein [Alphaproteobacteria bacterium]